MNATRWVGLIGAALALSALSGCSREEEAPAATGPSASAAALEPLIQQYAQIERPEEEEMGGRRDVSAAGYIAI